jgi:hypothetical protein
MPAYCGNDCTSDCGHCKGRNLRPEVWAMINEAWGGHVASTVKALVGRYERAVRDSSQRPALDQDGLTSSGRAIGYAQAVGLLIGRSMGQVMVDINKGDL